MTVLLLVGLTWLTLSVVAGLVIGQAAALDERLAGPGLGHPEVPRVPDSTAHGPRLPAQGVPTGG